MAYGNDTRIPDYIVSAGVRGEKKTYVRVGIAYKSTQPGKNHINVRLQVRPWDNWDGTLYLNENTSRQPGDDDIPL